MLKPKAQIWNFSVDLGLLLCYNTRLYPINNNNNKQEPRLITKTPAPEKKAPKIKPPPKHYVRNKDLLPEIIDCREKGIVSDKLGRMLLLIVDNYARKWNWVNYTFRDDMKGHALVHLSNAALKFDPARSNNPFAYYTQVTKNAFIQIIKQERKHRNIRDAKLLEQGLDPSYTFTEHWKAELKAQLESKLTNESDESHHRQPEKVEKPQLETLIEIIDPTEKKPDEDT